jgi:hypothetical protein
MQGKSFSSDEADCILEKALRGFFVAAILVLRNAIIIVINKQNHNDTERRI